MMTSKKTNAFAAALLAACFTVSAHAATQEDVEAARNESTYRTIAVHCSSKSFAKEFIASSKKWIRNSYADHAELEKIASSRTENADEIASWGPSDCTDFDQKLHILAANRAKADAELAKMMKKFVK